MIVKQHQIKNANPAPESDETNELSLEKGLRELASAALAESWTDRVQSAKAERLVSPNELTSLSALIAYVASKTGGNEFGIERRLADRFNIANVKCLPAHLFDEALRYLADQVM